MLSKNQSHFLWGTFVGGAIGTLVALFTTPASGAKLREQIYDELNGKKVKKHTHRSKHLVVKKGMHTVHARPKRKTSRTVKARNSKHKVHA